jgi:hypothetical protein
MNLKKIMHLTLSIIPVPLVHLLYRCCLLGPMLLLPISLSITALTLTWFSTLDCRLFQITVSSNGLVKTADRCNNVLVHTIVYTHRLVRFPFSMMDLKTVPQQQLDYSRFRTI